VNDLIAAVKQVHGIVHVIFHPAHSSLPAVNDAMHEFIEKVQSSGGIFARSIDIAKWTFDRKNMVANGIATSPSAIIQVRKAGRWVLFDACV
jgi:hypothetical protein